jgi:peptidoglycan L-alanyl-D-glutamate endopeptidase CwlK
MSSRSVSDLQPDVRRDCVLLMNKAAAEGMSVTLIDTLRSPAEQQVKIATGVSWTQNSLHEPQPPDGLARAFDLAPTELIVIKGWAPESPLWKQLGAWGKALGLEWGGDWPYNPPHSKPDPSHFQLRHPATTTLADADTVPVVPEQQV